VYLGFRFVNNIIKKKSKFELQEISIRLSGLYLTKLLKIYKLYIIVQKVNLRLLCKYIQVGIDIIT